MKTQSQPHPVIIKRKQVEARTALSRSAIYAKMKRNPKRPGDYDPSFPRPVALGAKAVGWIEEEINAWINTQIERSRNAQGGKEKREVAV